MIRKFTGQKSNGGTDMAQMDEAGIRGPDSNDTAVLELDALRALSGADDVRKRLSAGLSLGNPSLEDLAYLIKIRVKDHRSLIRKVLDKRETKPDYLASSATDIVGLRILTLYRSDLHLVLRSLLRFVSWAQREPFSLFAGETLADAVEEAIIYRPADPQDIETQLVVQEFQNHGFVPSDYTVSHDPVDIPLQVLHKRSEYTSIHLVLWCTGVTRDARFRVPLEVQLRTSLEDMWGEIEHRLHYKGQKSVNRFYEFAVEHLRALKRNLDTCSDTADLIQRQMSVVFESTSFEPTEDAKSVSVQIHRLNRLDLPLPLQAKIDETVSRLITIYRNMYHNSFSPSKDSSQQTIREFSDSAEAFSETLLEYEQSPLPDSERDNQVRYLLLVEKALCLYWRAFLLKIAAKDDLRGEFDASNAINAALQEYVNITKDARFATDAMLAFRLANALYLHGDSELALDKYQEAVNLLPLSSLPENHYMRVRITRRLGIALWEQGEEIKHRATRVLGLGNTPNRRRLLYYLEALDVTNDVLDFSIGDGESEIDDIGSKNSADEKRITANNVLEYAMSFLNAGGTWEELSRHNFTTQKMEELLKVVVGDGLDSVKQPAVADTIRAVAKVVRNRPLAREAAKRVLEIIGNRDLNVPLSDESYDEMRRDALAELDER
jgi:ppGpp synthetase/RelA/SpoT-type nucleotidyltranferase